MNSPPWKWLAVNSETNAEAKLHLSRVLQQSANLRVEVADIDLCIWEVQITEYPVIQAGVSALRRVVEEVEDLEVGLKSHALKEPNRPRDSNSRREPPLKRPWVVFGNETNRLDHGSDLAKLIQREDPGVKQPLAVRRWHPGIALVEAGNDLIELTPTADAATETTVVCPRQQLGTGCCTAAVTVNVRGEEVVGGGEAGRKSRCAP
ncbi:MAG: hypothetical protein ACREBC_07095 [Pyrinomonadaceae bacterium]